MSRPDMVNSIDRITKLNNYGYKSDSICDAQNSFDLRKAFISG